MSSDDSANEQNKEEQIVTTRKPRVYKSPFDIKSEKICPYSECGRKFVSDA